MQISAPPDLSRLSSMPSSSPCCVVVGIFYLSTGTYDPNDPRFATYLSAINFGGDMDFIQLSIRLFTSVPSPLLPDNTPVFLTAKAAFLKGQEGKLDSTHFTPFLTHRLGFGSYVSLSSAHTVFATGVVAEVSHLGSTRAFTLQMPTPVLGAPYFSCLRYVSSFRLFIFYS